MLPNVQNKIVTSVWSVYLGKIYLEIRRRDTRKYYRAMNDKGKKLKV